MNSHTNAKMGTLYPPTLRGPVATALGCVHYRYLERQEFLQRTDLRQYELEREERLKKYRRLC